MAASVLFSEAKEVAGFDERIRSALKYGSLFSDFFSELFTDRYEFEDEGDAFTLASLGFLSGQNAWLRELFESYFDKTEALAQALYFQKRDLALSWISRLAKSSRVEHLCVVVRTCVLVGQRLPEALEGKVLTTLSDADAHTLVAGYLEQFRLLSLLKVIYLSPSIHKDVLKAYLALDAQSVMDQAINYWRSGELQGSIK